jgi:hypothetical protein
MRKMIVCAVAGFAFLSPTVHAQSQDMSMLSDKRFWQGPDAAKINQKIERRSQQALESLEKQRNPHGDQFGRVEGGSRNSAG